MKGYGAIEMGVHRFHHPGHEDTEGVGEGIIHLWQYKDGVWRITRVMTTIITQREVTNSEVARLSVIT